MSRRIWLISVRGVGVEVKVWQGVVGGGY